VLERSRLNKKGMSVANGFILGEAPHSGWLRPLYLGLAGWSNPSPSASNSKPGENRFFCLKGLPSLLGQKH